MFLDKWKFKGEWRKYQNEVLNEFDNHIKDKKINVVAAPGSGKTILGLEMVRKLNEHVLILTPTITIKNQWKERFFHWYVPNNEKVDFISTDIYNLDKFNIATYQALHYAFNKKKINEELAEIVEDEDEINLKVDKVEYDLVQELKNKNIKTLVLDEAHHLRTEWWKTLKAVIQKLQDINIISLTATPPYDVDENEWKRYEEVCGTIDAEISVPELVATGDLCPHQDYVIFNKVSKSELNKISEIKEKINDLYKEIKNNKEIIDIVKSNKVLKYWDKNEEIILVNVEYYASLIIFLNSTGIKIDKKLTKLISGGTIIPNFNKIWAEILLKNIIFEHKEDYIEYEDLLLKLKKQMEILGIVEKRNIYLTDVPEIKKILASSIGKLDSIEEIVKREYNALKDDLSMVILADYVRSDFLDCNDESINKLGVVPIFRRLHQKNICNSIVVLTGKLKIVPKNLLPYIKEQLELRNIYDDTIYSELKIDKNYIMIKGSKKIENTIVEIITECINLKMINVVIGTVALLGEGWDAPAVNSLILASYVGSFMLSNQMRGRALRKSRNQNKTANIWHLSSFAVNNKEVDFGDLETLERRFNSFVGIGYYDDIIQSGIERLSIISKEKLKKDYNSINEEMFKLASNRNEMAMRWKKILEKFGNTNVKMVDKLINRFEVKSKVFVTMDFQKMLIWILLSQIAFFIFQSWSIAPTNINSVFIGRTFIIIVIISIYLMKIVKHLNPINYLKEISTALLNSMIENKNILTSKHLISIEIEKIKVQYEDYYKIYLKGASIYENNLFIKSIEEIYSKVVDNRYIICVGKKNKLSKDSYFNVPNILDNDKNSATLFWNEWNKNVVKSTLIYTRKKEGRKQLLKARKNSLSYNENFFVRKETSKWE